jgi:hypothetical protein
MPENDDIQIIKIMQTEGNSMNANQLVVPTWSPVLGTEFHRYVNKLPQSHADRLSYEAPHILEVCVKPGQVRQNAGLVLGYVQSGKTSSFIAATALAHDNNYGAVIVIGGVSKILLEQTEGRFVEDLELTADDVPNRWMVAKNPKLDTEQGNFLLEQIKIISEDVRNGRGIQGNIPLIFVMKNSTHLKNLAALLAAAAGPDREGLSNLTTLVVDDEAHMHTPNVAKDVDEVSKIYSLMRTIRQQLPSHSLLQYTATPQANLLTALDDEFSPDFVRLLGTGDEYVGGKTYFKEVQNEVIRDIPKLEQDVALAASVDDPSPQSLRLAFASYLVIAASDRADKAIAGRRDFDRFSMLVHAAGLNITHATFTKWLDSLKGSWRELFGPNGSPEDLTTVIDKYFGPAHLDLVTTSKSPILQLDELKPHIHDVLGRLRIWEINQAGTKEIDWAQTNYNVINGGDLLGVGFTVKRLHVTHMMRKPGGMQMDTIQQRGRFFGYTRPWLDKVRVWLEGEVVRQFENYVEQEEYLREDLRPYDEGNLSLRDWKRRFRLNDKAKLCRRAAIRLDIYRFATNESWTYQNFRIEDDDRRGLNATEVESFLSGTGNYDKRILLSPADPRLCGGEDPEHGVLTKHLHGTTTPRNLLEMLASYTEHERDRDNFEVVRLVLEEFQDKEEYQSVDVYVMAGQSETRRRRKLGPNGKVDLAQGHNNFYVGDRKVRNQNRIALQIFHLDHGRSDAEIEEQDVVYIGVSMPQVIEDWAKGWMLQRND